MEKEKKTVDKFNEKKFTFIESEIFKIKELLDLFRDFLKTEHNIEPLQFIVEIKELDDLTDEEEYIKKCYQIFEDYFNINSKYELNISNMERINLRNRFIFYERTGNFRDILNIFDIIYFIIKKELMLDNYLRYF
jgi:hypothetical protein